MIWKIYSFFFPFKDGFEKFIATCSLFHRGPRLLQRILLVTQNHKIYQYNNYSKVSSHSIIHFFCLLRHSFYFQVHRSHFCVLYHEPVNDRTPWPRTLRLLISAAQDWWYKSAVCLALTATTKANSFLFILSDSVLVFQLMVPFSPGPWSFCTISQW